MWNVSSHTASQLRPLMVRCPGIFSALSLWVPTLGADMYLVHLYPDTQSKMYTYKGSGNVEFQRTVCLRFQLSISACVANFSKACESLVLLWYCRTVFYCRMRICRMWICEFAEIGHYKWIQTWFLSIPKPRMDQESVLFLFLSVCGIPRSSPLLLMGMRWLSWGPEKSTTSAYVCVKFFFPLQDEGKRDLRLMEVLGNPLPFCGGFAVCLGAGCAIPRCPPPPLGGGKERLRNVQSPKSKTQPKE